MKSIFFEEMIQGETGRFNAFMINVNISPDYNCNDNYSALYGSADDYGRIMQYDDIACKDNINKNNHDEYSDNR